MFLICGHFRPWAISEHIAVYYCTLAVLNCVGKSFSWEELALLAADYFQSKYWHKNSEAYGAAVHSDLKLAESSAKELMRFAQMVISYSVDKD